MLLWWPSIDAAKMVLKSQKTWPPGAGLVFAKNSFFKKFKKSSSPKPLVIFHCYFVARFLFRPSTKVVQRILISQKTWPPGVGLVFLLYLYGKLKILKIFFSETGCQISIIFCYNGLLVTLYQSCSNDIDISKNMAARGGASFPSLSIW